MKLNESQLKNVNIYLDDFKIDKRIIPLFKTPITLKKIELIKKSKISTARSAYSIEKNKFGSVLIQKNLTSKIIPLNKKLVKYSKIIERYKKRINKLILRNIKIKKKNINDNKFLFLNNEDISKYKLYLDKLLRPLSKKNKYKLYFNMKYFKNSRKSKLINTDLFNKKNNKNKMTLSSILNKEFKPKSLNNYIFTINSHLFEKTGFNKLNKIYNSLYNPVKANNLSKDLFIKEPKSINLYLKNSRSHNLLTINEPKSNNLKDKGELIKTNLKKQIKNVKIKSLKNKKIFNNKVINLKFKSFLRKKPLVAIRFSLPSGNKNRLLFFNNLKKSKKQIMGRLDVQTSNYSIQTHNLKNNWFYWVNNNLRLNSTRKSFLNKYHVIMYFKKRHHNRIYVPKGKYKEKYNAKFYQKNKKNLRRKRKVSYLYTSFKLFVDSENLIKDKTNSLMSLRFKKLGVDVDSNRKINNLVKNKLNNIGGFKKILNRKINRKLINFYLPYLRYNFRNSISYQSKIKNKLFRKLNNDYSYQLKLLSALRLILTSKKISKGINVIKKTLINKKIMLNNYYLAKEYKSLAKNNNFNLLINIDLPENNLKRFIEIKNLLLSLKRIKNNIEALIRLRQKIILNKKFKIIKKILVEQALELEKNRLKKKIEIFDIESKNSVFPIKNYFFQKEILKFKQEFELMLSSSYNLFILIKDDLPFELIEANPLSFYIEKNKSELDNSKINNGDNTQTDINSLINKAEVHLENKNLLNNKLVFSKEDSKHSNYAVNKKVKKDKSSLIHLNKNMFYIKYLSNNFNNKNNLSQNLITRKNIKRVSLNNINKFIAQDKVKKLKSQESVINPANKLKKTALNIVSLNQNNKLNTYSNILTFALEENKKKIVETFKNMIFKHKRFDGEVSIIKNSAPVNIIFYSKLNKPIISQYLKSMSIYNRIIKGTFIYFSNSIGYFYNKRNYKKFKNIYKFLFFFFKTMFCLISRPVFVYKTDKIIIQLYYFLFIPLFYKSKLLRRNRRFKEDKILYKKRITAQRILYRKYLVAKKMYKNLNLKFLWRKYKKPYRYPIRGVKMRVSVLNFKKKKTKIQVALKKVYNVPLVRIFPNKFKIICNVLSKAFNKNVELNLIRLHYPYLNSNIFANLLALLINKIKMRVITRDLFKFSIIKNIKNIFSLNHSNYIPAYLTGLNIKIGGRLMKYSIIPRKTVQKVQKGSSSFGKVNYTDFARYTSKNKRGAFSITVSSGQNFFN